MRSKLNTIGYEMGKSQERKCHMGIGGDKKDYYAYDRHLDNQNTFPQINFLFAYYAGSTSQSNDRATLFTKRRNIRDLR